jgi:3-methyladenine DNA glycosylase/8-oxoguanine DNA glycosylase
MLAYSRVPVLEMLIPSNVSLVVIIRDQYDARREVNLSSVSVIFDDEQATAFIDHLLALNPVASSTNNRSSFHQILALQNQNQINQLIVSFAQYFNQLNHQLLQQANSGQSMRSSHPHHILRFFSICRWNHTRSHQHQLVNK